jgi:hypothetical protein
METAQQAAQQFAPPVNRFPARQKVDGSLRRYAAVLHIVHPRFCRAGAVPPAVFDRRGL